MRKVISTVDYLFCKVVTRSSGLINLCNLYDILKSAMFIITNALCWNFVQPSTEVPGLDICLNLSLKIRLSLGHHQPYERVR